MNKKIKLPISVLAFFCLIYFNQGISGLPGQILYYLTREFWGLSLTKISLIGFITGVAWYIKPLFGIIIDNLPIGKNKVKNYLYINYSIILLCISYICFFGLTITSLIVTSLFINLAIAFSDVINDQQMCKIERKYKLFGRIQCWQWTSLGIAGLIVSLLGAFIADKCFIPFSYKLAYGLTAILPIVIILYLFKYYKEEKVSKKLKIDTLKTYWLKIKNKSFLIGILFIVCLNFCPSFGTAFMVQMREKLGISKMFIGFLGAIGTVLSIVGYMLYNWKAYKFPIKKLLYFTVAFGGITNLCYLYIPNKWIILLYSVLFGAFSGISFLTILAFFTRIIPNKCEGFFYAIVTSFNNLASHGGDILGGVIYDHTNYVTVVLLSSITTFLCLFIIPKLDIK